jgi:phosphomannomutase
MILLRLSSYSAYRLRIDITPVKFVNTSMHGVSDAFASEVFKRAGFKPYIPVEEQKVPDPNFPTVRFPNPEEKGMEHM